MASNSNAAAGQNAEDDSVLAGCGVGIGSHCVKGVSSPNANGNCLFFVFVFVVCCCYLETSEILEQVNKGSKGTLF